MRVERRKLRKSRALGNKAEAFWRDKDKRIQVGDSLRLLEAKLAAIKPKEVTC